MIQELSNVLNTMIPLQLIALCQLIAWGDLFDYGLKMQMHCLVS